MCRERQRLLAAYEQAVRIYFQCRLDFNALNCEALECSRQVIWDARTVVNAARAALYLHVAEHGCDEYLADPHKGGEE